MCLSGRPPFQSASHLETLRQVIDSEPVPLLQMNSAVPRDLETITHKCLEKSAARRYASAKAFADDLDRFLNGKPIVARPVSSVERGLRWCKRNPAQVFNFAAVIIIVTGTLFSWWYVRAREREVAVQKNAQSLLEQLNVASIAELPEMVQQIREEPRATKLLREQYQMAMPETMERYRADVGLLQVDESVAECESSNNEIGHRKR
jgi:hypothetical protein